VRDSTERQGQRAREIEVGFDLMIGADGAHSAVRYHMMKYTRMDYQQVYIDTLWCEFQIPPKTTSTVTDLKSKFLISPNHLHIWPGREFMFIAIPSDVRDLLPLPFLETFAHSFRMALSPAPSLRPRRSTNTSTPTQPALSSRPSSTSTSPA
jgi:kynurenine 3-monooxygenase